MHSAYIHTDLVCDDLHARGWTIEAKNWRPTSKGTVGELPVAARTPHGVLVGVDVISLPAAPKAGTPATPLTPRRVAQLRALLARWLSETESCFTSVRIDTATVYPLPHGESGIDYQEGAA